MSPLMVRGFAGRVKPGEAIQGRKGTAEGTLLLSDLGLANVREKPGMGGAALSVVGAGFVQAEGAVDGEADIGGVFVLLAIVLPPADGAQRQRARRLQRLISATRAAKTGFQWALHGA